MKNGLPEDGTDHPVYISYRWDGAKQHARQLQRALEERGLSVFRDESSLKPGEPWPIQLEQGLRRAASLLVLIDPRWLHHQGEYGRRKLDDPEDWVRREVETSLAKKIPIVPILLEDTMLPPSDALPESLRPLNLYQGLRLRLEEFDTDADHIAKALMHLEVSGTVAPPPEPTIPFRLLNLELAQFRCFEHIQLDLTQPSTLDGDWTCIAGINGSGKSTILQAIALLMMGPKRALELGGARLNRMRRSGVNGKRHDSVLRARVQLDGEIYPLELSLVGSEARGPESRFWQRVERRLTAGYGANRNLSEAPDRYEELSPTVKTCISLFDPMARLQKAEKLLGDRNLSSEHRQLALNYFREIIHKIFDEALEIQVDQDTGHPLFLVEGSAVRANELPDGFRSSAAWLADLCSRWSVVGPSSASLKEMSGLALVDEIDLHLHASLQRAIIPRLREALPNVQFIVTSHAPLILASFDRNELLALDREADGGIRPIHRQVYGFTADEVYEWLLGTPASSETMEREIDEAPVGSPRRLELAEILGSADEIDEEAKERIAKFRQGARVFET